MKSKLFWETPQETAAAIGRIVASKKPHLIEPSTEKAEKYIEKYRKDPTGEQSLKETVDFIYTEGEEA